MTIRDLIKRKLTKGDIFIIIANLIPVYGVWFEDWSATEAFIVYALETLIIGLLTVLKLLIATFVKGKDNWYNNGSSTMVSGFFFIFFFIIHFGLFALVQTTIFSQAANITPKGSGMMHFFFHWPSYINEEIGIMLAGFVVSYLFNNFLPFVVNADYRRKSMMLLMFEPYGRIFIQQFTVILGSMFLSFGFGKGFILVFALAKLFFDLYVNFEELMNKGMDEMEKKSTQQ